MLACKHRLCQLGAVPAPVAALQVHRCLQGAACWAQGLCSGACMQLNGAAILAVLHVCKACTLIWLIGSSHAAHRACRAICLAGAPPAVCQPFGGSPPLHIYLVTTLPPINCPATPHLIKMAEQGQSDSPAAPVEAAGGAEQSPAAHTASNRAARRAKAARKQPEPALVPGGRHQGSVLRLNGTFGFVVCALPSLPCLALLVQRLCCELLQKLVCRVLLVRPHA